jgi:hypothetical protein
MMYLMNTLFFLVEPIKIVGKFLIESSVNCEDGYPLTRPGERQHILDGLAEAAAKRLLIQRKRGEKDLPKIQTQVILMQNLRGSIASIHLEKMKSCILRIPLIQGRLQARGF